MTHPPLKLLLGKELWLPDLVTTLVGLGHEVSVMDTTPDAIISYEAWRIPPGTSQSEILTHVGMILKQVRATKHVPDTTEDTAQVGAGKKSRKPVKRKRVAKDTGSAAQEEPGHTDGTTGADTGC